MPFDYRYPGAPFALRYARQNVAANLTSLNLPSFPGLANTWRTYIGRPYQIRGISLRLFDAVTAGTLFVRPTIGGGEVGSLIPTLHVGEFVVSQWQPQEIDVNDGNGSVGLSLTTSAGFTPDGTLDLVAVLWIELLNG